MHKYWNLILNAEINILFCRILCKHNIGNIFNLINRIRNGANLYYLYICFHGIASC